MRNPIIKSTLIAGLLGLGLSTAYAARDHIMIVGSSTVYPFATVVAEHFGKNTRFKTPKIESTGSGGGLKLFCAGAGVDTPDITNASRKIKASEIESCRKNGVNDIVEVRIGYDGIALANSRATAPLALSLRDIQSLQDLEGGQQRPAGHRHRGAGSAADLRHPRRLRGTGHGGGLRHL